MTIKQVAGLPKGWVIPPPEGRPDLPGIGAAEVAGERVTHLAVSEERDGVGRSFRFAVFDPAVGDSC